MDLNHGKRSLALGGLKLLESSSPSPLSPKTILDTLDGDAWYKKSSTSFISVTNAAYIINCPYFLKYLLIHKKHKKFLQINHLFAYLINSTITHTIEMR